MRDVLGRLFIPALFCLHGNRSHRGIWRPVAEQLPEHRRPGRSAWVRRQRSRIVTSPEGITSLMDGLPDREVRKIEGGSHMLCWERLDVASETIRDFLRRRAVEVM